MNSVSTEVAWNKMMEMGQARQRAVWETCSESGGLLRNRARVPHFPIMSRSWAACACDECHQMRNIDKIQKNVRATRCSVFAPPTGWKWGSDPSAQASFFRHGKLFTNVIHLNEFHAVSMCLSRALMMTRKQWVTDAWLGRIWRDWMQWVRRWWRRDFRMNLTQSQHAQIQVFGLGVGDCGSPFHFHRIRSFNFWCKLLRLACPLRTSTVYSYPWTFMDWCRYRSINAQETLILWDEDVQTKTNLGRCNDVSSHPGTIDLSWFGELFATRRKVSSTSIAYVLVLKHWPTSVGFVNLFSSEATTTNASYVGSSGVSLVLSLMEEARDHSPTAEPMVTHRENDLFMVRQMIIHCTNLRSVVSERCDFFLNQIVVGETKLNWHLVLNTFLLRTKKSLHAKAIFTSIWLFCRSSLKHIYKFTFSHPSVTSKRQWTSERRQSTDSFV